MEIHFGYVEKKYTKVIEMQQQVYEITVSILEKNLFLPRLKPTFTLIPIIGGVEPTYTESLTYSRYLLA